MNPDVVAKTPESGPAEPPSEARILADIRTLWDALYGLSYDRFLLAALETRRAGQSLVIMMIAGAMLALLLSAAWLGLLAGAVYWLVEKGLPASNALLIAVAINLLLALILFGLIRRNSRYLQFPAILRSFKPQPKQRSQDSQ